MSSKQIHIITAILILSILTFNNLFSQENISKDKFKSITFKVSDVKITSLNLPEIDYIEAIERKISRKVEGYSIESNNKKLVPNDLHPFLAAVHFAYAEHRPLVISPDMIWLMICQGFSIHLNQNYENLRDSVVTHEGIKEILVERHDFRKERNNPWSEVFETFTDSLKYNIKDSLYNLIVTDFTTTGVDEKTAYEITLLETTSKYFAPSLWTGCGIPEITLEGSLDDWKWIRKNIEQFNKYNFTNWVSNLKPILDEFVNASQGKINDVFWQSIYKKSKGYDAIHMTGWIIKFFPYYLENVHEVNGNQHLDYSKYSLNPYINGDDYYMSKLRLDNFPSGISKYEFKWKYQVGDVNEVFNMEIHAGFVGFSQDTLTKQLKPEISWAISNKDSIWHDSYYYFPNAEYGKEPVEYWYSKIEEKPDLFPIFEPKINKTENESDFSLDLFINNEISKLKKQNKLKGKVKIRFVITWGGSIAGIEIIESAGLKEDVFAINIVKSLKEWSPAKIKQNIETEETEDGFKEVYYNVNYAKILIIDFKDK